MGAYIESFVEFFNRSTNRWEPIVFVNKYYSNVDNKNDTYVSPTSNCSSYICNILADVNAIVYNVIDDCVRGVPDDASDFIMERFEEALKTGRCFNDSWYRLDELVSWYKDKNNFKSENYKYIKNLYGENYLKKVKKEDDAVRNEFKKIIDNIRFMVDNCYIICSDNDIRLVFWFIDN